MENNPETLPKPTRKRSKKAESLSIGDLEGTTQVDPKDVIELDSEKVMILHSGSNVRKTPRQRIAEWIEIRALNPDITNVEAAKMMGIPKQGLYFHIRTGVREGWLKFSDPMERMEHHIIPKVLKNLEKFLDEGDKQVTIEAAKGTIFSTYKEHNTTAPVAQTVLALHIETTQPETIKITSGTIIGKPKEIIEGESDEIKPDNLDKY